jgi:Family of unknown function (DUF6491)
LRYIVGASTAAHQIIDSGEKLHRSLKSLGVGAVALVLLAACASTGPAAGGTGAVAGGAGSSATPATSQQRALAHYSAYAGPPVQSFNWLGRFDSWEPLGKDHLLVYTRPNEAYLLKVSGPCDVNFATGPIGITSTNSTVYVGLDSIEVRTGVGGTWQCVIDEIHPVDVRRMRAEARAQGQQGAAQR